MDINKILKDASDNKSEYYNCIMHIAGDTNSLRQLFVITKIYGLRPLTVTFNHELYSAEEKQNIVNALEIFDCDNLMLTPRQSVINNILSKGIYDHKWFKNVGPLSLLINIAVRYKINIAIWPNAIESRLVEDQYLQTLSDGFRLDKLTDNGFSEYDINPYKILLTSEYKSDFYGINLDEEIDKYSKEISDFFNNMFPAPSNINNVKANHFWIGSLAFEINKQNTDRARTRYEKLSEESVEGNPLFGNQLRYCTRCCMPETAEELAFDELGMCQPCRSSEQKMHINWKARESQLHDLLDKYKSKSFGDYDCMVPISGGKDSTFQLYVLTQIYKLRPLAVTFSHNWYSETGRYNLYNAVNRFDVDHFLLTPRRSVINKLARKSLGMIGDSCWHCHAGVGAFPLQIAVKYNVNLLIWGESVSENDGRATYENPILFDRDYFTKISARFYAQEMVDDQISLYDVNPYILPTAEEIEQKNVKGIHLGDYTFWDDERQMEFVRDNYGWKEDHVEGTYKRYKSVECMMAGIHDYTKFIKRGYGRATDHASQDVRVGLMTREEGFELAKKYDTERPQALDYFLDITRLTEEEFEEVLKKKREIKAQKLP